MKKVLSLVIVGNILFYVSLLKWCVYFDILVWCLDGCQTSLAKTHHISLLHLYLLNNHFATAYGASIVWAVHCAIVQAQAQFYAYTPLQFFVAMLQHLNVCLCALCHKLFKFFVCHPIPNLQVRISGHLRGTIPNSLQHNNCHDDDIHTPNSNLYTDEYCMSMAYYYRHP